MKNFRNFALSLERVAFGLRPPSTLSRDSTPTVNLCQGQGQPNPVITLNRVNLFQETTFSALEPYKFCTNLYGICTDFREICAVVHLCAFVRNLYGCKLLIYRWFGGVRTTAQFFLTHCAEKNKKYKGKNFLI
jgi:hypothetical protein